MSEDLRRRDLERMIADDAREPVAIFPDALPVRLWRQRSTPPAVTVLCDQGKRQCRRPPLAYVFDTPDGAVLVAYQHTTDMPAAAVPAAYVRQEMELDAGREIKHYDADTERALLRGRTDLAGTVVCLERDDYWSNPVAVVSCRHHTGTCQLDRGQLVAKLHEARSSGQRVFLAVHP